MSRYKRNPRSVQTTRSVVSVGRAMFAAAAAPRGYGTCADQLLLHRCSDMHVGQLLSRFLLCMSLILFHQGLCWCVLKDVACGSQQLSATVCNVRKGEERFKALIFTVLSPLCRSSRQAIAACPKPKPHHGLQQRFQQTAARRTWMPGAILIASFSISASLHLRAALLSASLLLTSASDCKRLAPAPRTIST